MTAILHAHAHAKLARTQSHRQHSECSSVALPSYVIVIMADKGLRGKRSNIWMFFSPVPNKLNKAKCDTCGKEYSYVGGSTSNLYLHIRTKHPSLVGSLPSKKRRTWATADVQAPVNAGDKVHLQTIILDVKYLLLSENSHCLSLVECFKSLHYHKKIGVGTIVYL